MVEKFTAVIMRECSIPVQKVVLSDANFKAHLSNVVSKVGKAFSDAQSSRKLEEFVSSSSLS